MQTSEGMTLSSTLKTGENAILINRIESEIESKRKDKKAAVNALAKLKEQLDYLEKMGVTYIQGFYFSKPLPAADYLKFLEENN